MYDNRIGKENTFLILGVLFNASIIGCLYAVRHIGLPDRAGRYSSALP